MKLKKLALALGTAAALAASGSQAATVPAATFVLSPGANYTVLTPYFTNTPDTTSFFYELINGTVSALLTTVRLIDTIPDSNTINYSVYLDAAAAPGLVDTSGGTVLTGSFTDSTPNPFFNFLASGSTQYVLELSKVAGETTFASVANISAVPLPGALWLFGSALLGFLGFSNRRKI
jgi:hypothetical protein